MHYTCHFFQDIKNLYMKIRSRS